MNEKCYAKCVPKPGASLSSSEEGCLSRCSDRYLEACTSLPSPSPPPASPAFPTWHHSHTLSSATDPHGPVLLTLAPRASQSTSSRGATSPASPASASRPAPPPSSCKSFGRQLTPDQKLHHTCQYHPVQISSPHSSACLGGTSLSPLRRSPRFVPSPLFASCCLAATCRHSPPTRSAQFPADGSDDSD